MSRGTFYFKPLFIPCFFVKLPLPSLILNHMKSLFGLGVYYYKSEQLFDLWNVEKNLTVPPVVHDIRLLHV